MKRGYFAKLTIPCGPLEKCIMLTHWVLKGKRSREMLHFVALLARPTSRLICIGFLTGLSIAQLKDDRSVAGSKPVLGQVSGHVYRADTGEPIPKTQVSLLPTDEATAKATEERTVRTGPDGAFTFTDIPGGNYDIETSHNGYSAFNGSLDSEPNDMERTSRRVALKPGQILQNLVLHLYPSGVISGQLLDEEQDPIVGLPLFALRINFAKGGHRSGWRRRHRHASWPASTGRARRVKTPGHTAADDQWPDWPGR